MRSLKRFNVYHREQPLFSTKAHVFQIDPATKRNWIPASKHAVTVSFFYDASRTVYRIISVGGTKVKLLDPEHYKLYGLNFDLIVPLVAICFGTGNYKQHCNTQHDLHQDFAEIWAVGRQQSKHCVWIRLRYRAASSTGKQFSEQKCSGLETLFSSSVWIMTTNQPYKINW